MNRSARVGSQIADGGGKRKHQDEMSRFGGEAKNRDRIDPSMTREKEKKVGGTTGLRHII